MLSEQHPATAAALLSICAACSYTDSLDTTIMVQDWALRMKLHGLGLHPATALTMSCIGVEYSHKMQRKKSIDLSEQAVRIYERTVGRMHRGAAYVFLNMSTSYAYLCTSGRLGEGRGAGEGGAGYLQGDARPVQHVVLRAIEKFHSEPKRFYVTPNLQK